MKKKILLITMAMVMILGAVNVSYAASHESKLNLNVEAAKYDVDVPTTLTANITQNGVVTTATNLRIKNSSHGPVKVSSVGINGIDGWQIVDFNTDMTKEKANAKKISFKLNNSEATSGTGLIPVNATNFPRMEGIFNDNNTNNILALSYSLNIPTQVQGLDNEDIAKITFVIDWDSN